MEQKKKKKRKKKKINSLKENFSLCVREGARLKSLVNQSRLTGREREQQETANSRVSG